MLQMAEKMERKKQKGFTVLRVWVAQVFPLIHKLSTNNQLKVKVFILGVDSGKNTYDAA